ncbi:MAG: glycosyltransferase family 4 protein [Pseudonocardiales bacterium]
MRVLGFGTYNLATHPRPGVILDGLRACGDDVTEINEPLGFSTGDRVEMLGKPWLAYRLVGRLLARWASLIRRSLPGRRHAHFDVVIVGYLGHFDVTLARLLYPRSRIALDQMIFALDTARDRGTTHGAKLRLLGTLDALAVRCADVVILDTEEQLTLLAERTRHKAVVVPVGASQDWFEAAEHRAAAAGPAALRVVFFGVYTPLQGALVIGEALARLADRADILVTMVGGGQDYEATRAAAAASPHVTWVEWLDQADLVSLVQNHDVCLGIFGDSPKAQRVVPNKVYQGAAAGCAIVTSDTAPQRRMLGDAALYVTPGDPGALASALTDLAGDQERTQTLKAAARSIATARFTPVSVAEPLRERLLKD